MKALIGSTGFVGGVLGQASAYDLHIHRSNLQTLRGQRLSRAVCAGLPAAKWLANRNPEADRANMEILCSTLATVQAETFVLISTVDVYATPVGLDEAHDVAQGSNHAYGTHRQMFEAFVRQQFPHALIVRLPALFGPGLKKNVLFDLINNNGLDVIQPDSAFQWYPLTQLAADIARCEAAGLRLVNLVPEPLATRQIIKQFFPQRRVGANAGPAVRYDLRSRHAEQLGGAGGYTQTQAAVITALQHFLRVAA